MHRPRAIELGGKSQFPYLVDPNTGTRMYESDDIVAYLYVTYGGREPGHAGPRSGRDRELDVGIGVPSESGTRALASRQPAKPLELWSFEASPFCRIAREALSELELPYVLHNVGKDGAGRPDFVARSGKMMVPYLVDPNTGREMFESAEIRRYLNETYGA